MQGETDGGQHVVVERPAGRPEGRAHRMHAVSQPRTLPLPPLLAARSAGTTPARRAAGSRSRHLRGCPPRRARRGGATGRSPPPARAVSGTRRHGEGICPHHDARMEEQVGVQQPRRHVATGCCELRQEDVAIGVHVPCSGPEQDECGTGGHLGHLPTQPVGRRHVVGVEHGKQWPARRCDGVAPGRHRPGRGVSADDPDPRVAFAPGRASPAWRRERRRPPPPTRGRSRSGPARSPPPRPATALRCAQASARRRSGEHPLSPADDQLADVVTRSVAAEKRQRRTSAHERQTSERGDLPSCPGFHRRACPNGYPGCSHHRLATRSPRTEPTRPTQLGAAPGGLTRPGRRSTLDATWSARRRVR